MSGLIKSIIIVLGLLLISFTNENIEIILLSPAELKEDVFKLRRALEKHHPGIYWYTSKNQFDQAWDSLDAKIQEPMTENEFFKLLLPLVAKVKCAHTLFYPSEKMLAKGNRFPLDINFVNGKGYIMPDFKNLYNIPKGSELLAINGKKLNEIVDLLLPNLEAQGGNIGWKYVILENDFHNYYYYVIEQVESFEIEYLAPSTKQKLSAIVKGSSEEAFRSHWKNWYPEKDGAPLQLTFNTNPDVAIISIKSFFGGRYEMYDQNFEKLIDKYFSEIRLKRTRNLIIDVRGNEGGSEPIEKLFSYLKIRETKNIDKNRSYDKIRPAKQVYDGNVIVLTNENSISAQESFVAIFKYYNRGLTIGQFTSGDSKGLCGGNKHKLILPNSRHEIRIPLHESLRPHIDNLNAREGKGYPPNIRVKENIDDILAGKDSTMEVALSKIKS